MDTKTEKLRKTFIANVRAEMQRKDMRVGELAKACGLLTQCISRVLSGRHGPSLTTLSLIATALNVEPADLLKTR